MRRWRMIRRFRDIGFLVAFVSSWASVSLGQDAVNPGVLESCSTIHSIGSAPDLGAFEKGLGLPRYGPRPVAGVFQDGFESGDTGGWSLTVP